MIKDPPFLTISRNFPRPNASDVAAFAGVPTGYAVDAMGGRGALDYRIKPLAPASAVLTWPYATAASWDAPRRNFRCSGSSGPQT